MSYFGVAPIKSDVNSTSTVLTASQTFTGTWEEVPRSMVVVQSYSDQAGTLYFDFSVDGVNADSTFPVGGFATTASVPMVQPAAVGGRYFRVRYVNGSVDQTEFRLGTYYNDISNFHSPLNQPYNLQSSAILTRSSFPWLDVARSLNTSLDTVKKFGRNPSVGTSYVPLSIGGVYQTPQSGSATTLRIKAGGNANDDAAGTGARSITLEGTDENFAFVSESVATAGASASSATTATFTRLYRAYVTPETGSGTYATSTSGSHAGDIVIEDSGGTADWATIDSTSFPKSQTEIGAYTVAAGVTGYVKLRDLSIDSGKTIDLVFFSRENADETTAPYTAMRAQSVVTGVSGGSIESFGSTDVPFGPYIGPTDIGFMAKVASGTASVSVEFEIFIVSE